VIPDSHKPPNAQPRALSSRILRNPPQKPTTQLGCRPIPATLGDSTPLTAQDRRAGAPAGSPHGATTSP